MEGDVMLGSCSVRLPDSVIVQTEVLRASNCFLHLSRCISAADSSSTLKEISQHRIHIQRAYRVNESAMDPVKNKSIVLFCLFVHADCVLATVNRESYGPEDETIGQVNIIFHTLSYSLCKHSPRPAALLPSLHQLSLSLQLAWGCVPLHFFFFIYTST